LVFQKLPKKIALSSGIAGDEVGFAKVCLGARGDVSTRAYKAETSGHTSFNKEGWKEFLTGKNLHRAPQLEDDDRHRHHLKVSFINMIEVNNVGVCVAGLLM
jgi:hypothetical protein